MVSSNDMQSYLLLSVWICLTGLDAVAVFPYKDFFETSSWNLTEFQKLTLASWLCTYDPEAAKSCSCDSNCFLDQSCCIDISWNETRSKNLEEYLNGFMEKSLHYKQVQCLKLLPNISSPHWSESLWLIDSCLAQTNSTSQLACKNVKIGEFLLPVQSLDGLVYRNKYCAICNGVYEFRFLNITAECNHKLVTNATSIFQQYEKCDFSLDETFGANKPKKARKCKEDVKQSCTNKTSRSCQLCHAYIGGMGLFQDNQCYRNYHCFKESLNDQRIMKDFWNSTELFSCLDAYNYVPWGWGSLPQYSLLISFESSNQLAKQGKVNPCKSMEFYDKASDTCIKDFVCGFGYVQDGSRCVKLKPIDPAVHSTTNFSDGGSIRSCFKFHEYAIIRNTKALKILDQIKHVEGKTVFANETLAIVEFLNVRNSSNESHKALHAKNISYQTIFSTSSFLYTELYGIDFSRIFHHSKVCAKPIQHQEFVISDNCSISEQNSSTPLRNFVLNIYTEKDGEVRELTTCAKFHLDASCRMRKIENFIISSNGSLILEESRAYSIESYVPLRSGIGVCIASSPKARADWLKTVGDIEGYVTVIGCSLSILAYFWVVLTYSCIRELRTVPGKSIASMCLTLLMSDVLMLLTTSRHSKYVSCKVLAVFQHYFALSAQFWCAAVAYDICTTFHGKSLKRNTRSQKRFLLYCCFAVICPLCVVLMNITLDNTNTVAIGYGKHEVCWITNLLPRLLTYVAVVIVLTLFTIVCLAYTVCKISKHSRKSKKLLQKSGGNNVSLIRMTLKLIVVLGIIEIIGFLQSSELSGESRTYNAFLKLFYSIIRSFRGVFVWFLYVVTDRVFTMYRQVRSNRSYRTSTRFSSVSQTSRYVKSTSQNNPSSYQMETTLPAPSEDEDNV